MTLSITNLARKIWYFAHPNDVQRTHTMGHASAGKNTVARFGISNRELGQYSENCLDVGAIFGVAGDYIKSYFSDSESVLLNGISKLTSAISDFFSGQRDHLMYQIFGDGVDSEVYSNVKHEKNALDEHGVPKLQTQISKKTRYSVGDDLAENLGQEQAFGESVVPVFGWLAALSAHIKPIVSPLAAFLPANFKSAIDSTIDLGARSWWRMRLFGTSLHANFLTSMVNLAKNGVLSIGSPTAREDLRKQVNGLGEFAKNYFASTGNTELAQSTSHSSMGLYGRMLADRVKSHWNHFWMKKEDLVQKLQNDGVIREGDTTDGMDLKLMAFSELTAPFCSAIGLAGTFIFEPLRILGKFMGLESGMGLISALSTSRKTTHLFNYLTRFMIPEWRAGNNEMRKLEEVINNGTATELEKQSYLNAQERRRNGAFGVFVAAGNIVEPLMQFINLGSSENKLTKFVFNLFTRFNDTGLLRFFSTRRSVIGTDAVIRSIAMEKNAEISKINMSKAEIEQHTSSVYKRDGIGEKLSSPVVDKVVRFVQDTKESLTSDESINHAFTAAA